MKNLYYHKPGFWDGIGFLVLAVVTFGLYPLCFWYCSVEEQTNLLRRILEETMKKNEDD